MVHKVGIIGTGHVGATVALDLVLRGSIGQLVLIDQNDDKAQAEQYDLTDQQALLSSNTQISVIPYASAWDLSDCDVLVFAPGDITLLQAQTSDPDRTAELRNSIKVVETVAPKIKAAHFKGILLSITNPCDVVVTYLQQLTGIPKQRIFGTGTTLDTTRMKHAVSDYLDCSIHDVEGFVLGEHGETQFTAWSTVKVASRPILELTKEHQIQLDDLQHKARMGAWNIIRGKGFTSAGIGLTATVIIEAILNDARQTFPLSSYNETYETYIGQPTRIGAQGIVEVVNVTLNETEKTAFQNSAVTVHQNFVTYVLKK